MFSVAAILSLIFKLAIPTVLTIQQVIGDAKSGADKATMAKDALAGATSAAFGVLGVNEQQYAALAAGAAQAAIDTAVMFTKLTGHYQTATAQAAATQKALAPAVDVPASLPTAIAQS